MAALKPLVIHRKEAAVLTGLSTASIDRAIARGQLKAKKYGKRSILLLSEVERFLHELPDQQPKTYVDRIKGMK